MEVIKVLKDLPLFPKLSPMELLQVAIYSKTWKKKGQ